MAKSDIYGQVPDGGVDEVVSEAMADLGSSSSNKVNGPVKTKDSQYPEGE